MKTRKILVCCIFAAILTLACADVVFAQRAAAAPEAGKNAASLDIIPLINGLLASDTDNDLLYVAFALSYERMILPHISIGAEIDFVPGKIGEDGNGDDIPYLFFSMGAAARYYPMSVNMEKFFFGTTLGFNVQSIDGKTKEEDGGFAGIFIGLRAGYKLMFGNSFFAEPSMSYTYSKIPQVGYPVGWQGGLRVGARF